MISRVWTKSQQTCIHITAAMKNGTVESKMAEIEFGECECQHLTLDARAAAEGRTGRTVEYLLLSSSVTKPVARDAVGSRKPPSCGEVSMIC